MHLKFRNINEAFHVMVHHLHTGKILTNVTASRYGECCQVEELLAITYEQPQERVLVNRARDANPFFHVYEAMWMLAGRNDVRSVAYYVGRMKMFSDDDHTIHDAYGYRWRHLSRHGDQLKDIISNLERNRLCRRQVLQMWDAEEDLTRVTHHPECVAVPCNLIATFQVEDREYLNMSVFNRSNDIVWGMLGANAVHFSFLQEYVAAAADLAIGRYEQITVNGHFYTKNWKPAEWQADQTPSPYADGCVFHPVSLFPRGVPTVRQEFDSQLHEAVDLYGGPLQDNEVDVRWTLPFLETVLKPMCVAWHYHKKRDYGNALMYAKRITDKAWHRAANDWLEKRARQYEGDGPNYGDGNQ